MAEGAPHRQVNMKPQEWLVMMTDGRTAACSGIISQRRRRTAGGGPGWWHRPWSQPDTPCLWLLGNGIKTNERYQDECCGGGTSQTGRERPGEGERRPRPAPDEDEWRLMETDSGVAGRHPSNTQQKGGPPGSEEQVSLAEELSGQMWGDSSGGRPPLTD